MELRSQLPFREPTSFREAEGKNSGRRYRESPNPSQSETPGMLGNSMRENREAPRVSGRTGRTAGEGDEL